MTRSYSITLVWLSLIAITLAPAARAQVGALDVTFDGDGMRTDSLSPSDVAGDVAVQSDGDIIVFGRSENPDNLRSRNGWVTIYRPDGSMYDSWLHAPLQFNCGSVPNYFSTGLVAPSDTIFAAGVSLDGCSAGKSNFDIVRYVPNGGTAHIFPGKPVFHGSYDEAFGLAYQSDGKIIAVGLANPSGDAALARYQADGSLDDTFGTGGEVLIDLAGGADRLRAVQVQSDGKIVAAGQAEIGGQDDALLVRLHPDGTLDTSFGDDGIVTRDFNGFDDLFRDLALQSDGKIVVAGRQTEADGSTTRFTVFRFHPDGSLDAAFGTDGVVVVDFTGLSAAATGIALQADGKIVAGGTTETGAGGRSTRDFAVARLHPDGTLDTSFDGDGKNTAEISSDQADTALGLAIEPSGHIVLAGITEWEDGDDVFRDIALARFVGDSAPLPVELTSFRATLDGGEVVLSWTTASETNNAGFDVQVQSNENDSVWEHVAFVEGSGTTHTPRFYRHRVDPLSSGVHRFRLKQIDVDGGFAFSPIVEVRIGAPIRFALHGAYPNPSNGVATIPFEVARATPVRMDVYDMLGRQVAVLVDEEHAPGRYQVPLDVRRLSAGVYLYRIRMGDFQATRKLTVMR
jgi:uncharacterized delta-60 repeat protein